MSRRKSKRNLGRREFLVDAALGSAALLANPAPGLLARLGTFRSSPDAIRSLRAGLGDGGYGPLEPAGAELALPEGFHYLAMGFEGTPLSNGSPTPRAHDGMGAFPLPNGSVRLIRNHEDREHPAKSKVIGNPVTAYDRKGGGGTTSLEVKIRPDGTPKLIRDFVSLNGTIVNCAGGPTPWGTWLSCEETTEGKTAGWEREHGYVFEVPVSAEAEVPAVPLKALGRFFHEAVAVDPGSGIVYLTEDQLTAGFYRFIPSHPGRLADGGKLEILAVKDQAGYDTRRRQRVSEKLRTVWVAIDDPDPPNAEAVPNAVYHEGHSKGAATFSRLEGCWFGNQQVYFHATEGGDHHLGQVWSYRPRAKNAGELTLLFESPAADVLDGPDNVTMSPRGGLVLCEDGNGEQFLRGLTRDGRIFDFARNIKNQSEFAGACFSPDGRVLFVNVQGDGASGGPGHLGMTFAIWGPWERGAL